MRVSRKFWGGIIAGGIVGVVIGAMMMPRMSRSWSMMATMQPDTKEMMSKQLLRISKITGM